MLLKYFFTMFILSNLALVFAGQEFDRAAARKQMLDLIAQERTQALEIKGLDQATPAQREFLKFYTEKVWPVLQDLRIKGERRGILNVAFDRALYEDKAEQKKWEDELVSLANELDRIIQSDQWKTTVQAWANLSKGLTGDLADEARRVWEEIEIGVFDEKMLPVKERLNVLELAIDKAAKEVPAASKRSAAEEKINKAASEYHGGKINFNEATKRIQAAELEGDLAFAKEVVENVGAELNEAAVLRTQLAKSKGFKNWAEYRLAVGGRRYSKKFQTVEGQIEFLEELLKATQKAYQHLLTERAKEIRGINPFPVEWHPSQVDHLLSPPADSLVLEYFPREEGEKRWRKAMLESGFSEEELSLITLDSLPRDGKYGHGGYMAPVRTHDLKVYKIAAPSLALEVPVDSSQYHPAIIYIVQNLRSDGPEGERTAFHEGGHALHYVNEVKPLGSESAYGYVEVPSMSMEPFLDDVDYVVRTQTTRDGKSAARELVERFVRNKRIADLIQIRTLASRALFDLQVWRQPYEPASSSEPAALGRFTATDQHGYIETSKRLWYSVMTKGLSYQRDLLPTYDWRFYSFVRPHFRSGWVQYAGYSFASVGADLALTALLDRLEKTTGRRSLDQQPSLASLLRPLYREGHKQVFPETLESYFAGSKFSPQDFAERVGQEALAYKARLTWYERLVQSVCGRWLKSE